MSTRLAAVNETARARGVINAASTSVGQLDPSSLTSPRHRLAQSIVLHLAPGAVALAVFVALLPVARQLGMPPIAALAASGLLAVAPVQLGVLAQHRRRQPREPAVLLRTRLPALQMAVWVLLEVVLGALAFVLTGPLTSWLRAHAFAWWPSLWVVDAGSYPGFGTGPLIATGLLMLLGSVVVAPG